jgi:alkane 1-monooxygenase
MLTRALGYFVILVPPILVPSGLILGLPGLGFVTLIVVAPLLRGFLGDAQSEMPEWTERIATALDVLPTVCAIVYMVSTGAALLLLRRLDHSHVELAWFGASLWAAFLFGTCVAHELVHRAAPVPRAAGRMLSGLLGYPFLEHEHRAHHARNGNIDVGECPRLDESVWAFSIRRMSQVVPTAWAGNALLAARRGRLLSGGLPLSAASLLLTASAFTLAAGLQGLLLYVAVAAAVGWALQAITYVQHWGLGQQAHDQSIDLGWEDHCQLQAWLTLGISFHQAHHRMGGIPYYRLQPAHDAPKAPAGYVVLFFASLVPPLWRKLMMPALLHWQRNPGTQQTAGRRLICFRSK